MAAYAIQFRRGTTLEHSAFTGEIGEVTVDTDKNTIVVHDGSTPGGHPLALYADLSGAPSSGSSGGSTGGASTTVSDTAPSNPSAGDFWYNSSTLGLFIYYNDGNSSQWVQVSGGVSTGETVISSDTAPSSPDSGDFWLDSTNLDLYVYYVDSNGTGQWIQVSAAAGTTSIGTGDTIVSTSDTGIDGTIGFTTDNVLRWEIKPTGHLIPNGNTLYDIGEPENKIRDLYMSTATIHTDGGNISTTDGIFKFAGEPVILVSTLKELLSESETFEEFKNNISNM